MMVLTQMNMYKVNSFDVETAFLNGELEENIYMKILQGLAEVEGIDREIGGVLRWNKSIYGLVQASWLWRKKFGDAIMKYDFQTNQMNSWMFL